MIPVETLERLDIHMSQVLEELARMRARREELLAEAHRIDRYVRSEGRTACPLALMQPDSPVATFSISEPAQTVAKVPNDRAKSEVA